MKLKLSLIFNITILLFVTLSSIMMFTGFKFMTGDIVLETTKLGMFKFFTVDSNIFMGFISSIFIIEEIKKLKGKIIEMPTELLIIKQAATVSVTLTFFIVFGYLGFIADGGVLSLLKNSNLFFHLLVPLTSIVTFIFFEKTDKLSFKITFFGIIPMFLYGFMYLINVLIHLDNGKIDPIYDWYYFVQGGIEQAFIVVPIIFIITYIISFVLWKLNRIK